MYIFFRNNQVTFLDFILNPNSKLIVYWIYWPHSAVSCWHHHQSFRYAWVYVTYHSHKHQIHISHGVRNQHECGIPTTGIVRCAAKSWYRISFPLAIMLIHSWYWVESSKMAFGIFEYDAWYLFITEPSTLCGIWLFWYIRAPSILGYLLLIQT